MQSYMEWVERLGAKAINPQMPLRAIKSVTRDSVKVGAPENYMMGMTLIDVESMDEAVAIAQDCPFLEMDNSSITVGEIMSMPR